MNACELKQTKLDPFLFIMENVILITWIDDFLLYSPKDKWIYEAIYELKIQGVYLNK